jgi:rubredoxin
LATEFRYRHAYFAPTVEQRHQSITPAAADPRLSSADTNNPVQPTVTRSSTIARRPDGSLEIWACSRCGYVYKPAEGEASTDTPPGVAFEHLPDDWCCPDCGSDKDYFFF